MAAISLSPVQGVQAALFGLQQLVSSSEKFRFFVVSELALLGLVLRTFGSWWCPSWFSGRRGVTNSAEDPWRNWVPGVAQNLDLDDNDSLFEWVQIETETDGESESVCVMFNTSLAVFDTRVEAHSRGLDESELMHCVFEHGVTEGLRKGGV